MAKIKKKQEKNYLGKMVLKKTENGQNRYVKNSKKFFLEIFPS